MERRNDDPDGLVVLDSYVSPSLGERAILGALRGWKFYAMERDVWLENKSSHRTNLFLATFPLIDSSVRETKERTLLPHLSLSIFSVGNIGDAFASSRSLIL